MAAIVDDLLVFAVFMLIAFIIREKVKIFQKYYISTAMIAGFLFLLVGNNGFKLIETPATFSQYPTVLINLVMGIMGFGLFFNLKRVRSAADFVLVEFSGYGFQMALSIFLGIVLSSLFLTLPNGWGYMALTSFYGGHGVAAGAAGVIQETTGGTAYSALGAVMSTVGLLVAVIVGMVLVNIGARKGWTAYLKADDKVSDDKVQLGGLVPEDKRQILGHVVTPQVGISALGMQIALLFTGMFLGDKLFGFLGKYVSFFTSWPKMVNYLLGCTLFSYVLRWVKLDKFIDKKAIGTLNGLLLDLIVFGAIATLNVKAVVDNIVPIAIMSLVVCAFTAVFLLGMSKIFCETDWFEKAIFMFGHFTGSNATGYALLRAADPNGRSMAWEAQGINYMVGYYVGVVWAMGPAMVAAGNLWTLVGMGLAFGVAGLVGLIVLKLVTKKKKA